MNPFRAAGAVAVELRPVREVDEPDNSMEAAAEVVEAIAVAETASGWLWVPS